MQKRNTRKRFKVYRKPPLLQKCAEPTHRKTNVNKYTFSNNLYSLPVFKTYTHGQNSELSEFKQHLCKASSIDEINGSMLSFSCHLGEEFEETLIEKLSDKYLYNGRCGRGGDTTEIEWSFISKDKKRLLTITALSHRGGPFLFATEWKDIIESVENFQGDYNQILKLK